MNPFEMTTIIVIAALIAGVLRSRYGTPRHGGGAALAELSAQSQAQQARIAQLEERVKALESVVTDSQYELRQRFRDLSAR